MHEFLHALEHAFKDTLTLLPWLIIIYMAIELIENKTDLASSKRLQGKVAPLIGSAKAQPAEAFDLKGISGVFASVGNIHLFSGLTFCLLCLKQQSQGKWRFRN